MKKILYILPLFFLAHLASASVLTEQTQGVSNGCTLVSNQYHCSGTATTTAAVNKWISNMDSSGDNSGCADNAWIYDSDDTTKLATSTAVSTGRMQWTFPTTTFVSGHNYFYRMDTLAVCGVAGSVVNHAYDATTGFYGEYYTGLDAVTATILYPENRTDIFIHDFNYFTFRATSLATTTQNFAFRIVYDTTSTFTNNPVTISRNINYSFAAGITHYLNIPKPEVLASSTTYYAKLCTSQNSGNFSCDTPISFKLGAVNPGFQINSETAGWFNTTTTEGAIMYPTSTTDITSETGLSCGTDFYNPANWACWAGQRIILFWNEIKNFAVTEFDQGTTLLLSVFPVNIISQVSTDLHSVQYATSTISSITLTGQNTAFKRPANKGGGYYSFTFLTSSTLQESETRVGWNWETIVIYLLWAMTGIVILGSAFALIKHAGHNSTPHA